jgi:hypothetical protein
MDRTICVCYLLQSIVAAMRGYLFEWKALAPSKLIRYQKMRERVKTAMRMFDKKIITLTGDKYSFRFREEASQSSSLVCN